MTLEAVSYQLVAGSLRFFLSVVMRWRWHVRGIEHVPAGRAVLAFNHISYTDAFVTGLPLVRRGLRPRFLVKQELFNTPVLGFLARHARMIPVLRGDEARRAGAFSEAVRFAQEGELVLVAPEQTISQSFELLPLRTGAVRMAQEAGVPIVPSANWGSQRFMTKGQPRRWAFGIPVSVAYGPAFHVGADDDPVEATRELERRMQALLDQVVDGYPDRPGPGDDWWQPASRGGTAPSHPEVLARHEDRRDLA